MSALKTTDNLFFAKADIDPQQAVKIIQNGLLGADDGELFLERSLSETLSWQDGRLSDLSQDHDEGFGVRFVMNEKVAYAHTSPMGGGNMISRAALTKAVDTVGKIRTYGTAGGTVALPQGKGANAPLYSGDNPLDERTTEDKIKLLSDIDQFTRGLDAKVRQVSIALTSSWQAVQIIRNDGERFADLRPMVRLAVSVVVEKDGRRESGSYIFGGRKGYAAVFNEAAWKGAAKDAVRQALVNLEAVQAPSGEMDVVLGNGMPGVMLHEAVGHGLEGDFNRMGTSAFSGRVGQQVTARGLTIVDRGDLPGRRGSLSFDDEGTPTQENVLIEDGILKGYMQDRMNARLMGVAPTGNGRRESYAHEPMPRMTTTFIKAGQDDPKDIIASVKLGLYAVDFAGGTVDIVSGNYNFAPKEAYMIRNGRIAEPVKGAMLVGNGPEDMTKVEMIGRDFNEATGEGLDPGTGVCGKSGQGVPVGLGLPTLKMRKITVGGRGGPS